MCSSAVVGSGDGLLINRQCWMGTKHRLCPRRSRDLLVATLELSPAVPQHHWPDVVARGPLSDLCANTGEPGPCKPVGRQRTHVPGSVAGPQHPQGLMCGCTAGSSCLSCSSPAPWDGVQGAGSPLHGAGTLHW